MNRQYYRELTQEDLKLLRLKYDDLLHRSRGGCLTTIQRRYLLQQARIEKGELSDTWYRIKNTCRDALADLSLISEVANEEVLEDILFPKPYRQERNRPTRYPDWNNSITRFIGALLSTRSDGDVEQGWRKRFLDPLICDILAWHVNEGIVKTEAHRRIIFETLDAILVDNPKLKVSRSEQGDRITVISY